MEGKVRDGKRAMARTALEKTNPKPCQAG